MRPTRIQTLTTAKCKTGCPYLDAFLRGGIPHGSLTELTGEATTCKTQLCLQLLLTSVQHGGRAWYVSTEKGETAIDRLKELAEYSQPGKLLQNVMIERQVSSPDVLLSILQHTDANLRDSPGQACPQLMIIDSVAGLLRDPGDGGLDYVERSSMFFQLAALLKRLAHCHNMAVIVTNQVMDVVDDSGGSETARVHSAGLELETSGRAVVPALGLAWANCVNTRLFLSRQGNYSDGRQAILRSMQVVFSPSLPQSYCYFRTTSRGVFGIGADELEALQPAAV